jgi:PEP-CTERM motif
MKTKNIFTLLLTVVLSAFAVHASATVLLYDDFVSTTLDTSKWSLRNTNPSGFGSSWASPGYGYLRTNNRPILTTVSTFSLPISVSGSFLLGTQQQADNLQIVTRADGAVATTWKEPAGLKFYFNYSGVSVNFMDDSGTFTTLGSSTGLTLSANTMYNFSITDYQSGFSVSVNDTVVYSADTSTYSTLSSLTTGNKVSLTNRERSRGSYWGPLTIATATAPAVPEPSTYGLIGLGALGVAITARRRKLKSA